MTDIQSHSDHRGELKVMDFNKIPFQVLRTFWVLDVPINHVVRGNHAHYTTKQFVVCVKGIVEVTLKDGKDTQVITLRDNGQNTLFIDCLIWDSYRFKENGSILQVFCNTNYDKSDYINHYDQFLEIKNKV